MAVGGETYLGKMEVGASAPLQMDGMKLRFQKGSQSIHQVPSGIAPTTTKRSC